MGEYKKQPLYMVVAECPQRAQIIQRSLADRDVIALFTEASGVFREVARLKPDVVILAVDSPDRAMIEDMHAITRDYPRPIVMFCNDARRQTIDAAVRAGIGAYVVDGLSAERVPPIVDVAIARFDQIHSMRSELADLRNRLAERKTIERAKGLLMKSLGLDEDSAYTALRKMAMNRNLKIVEVASSLITASDLLVTGTHIHNEILENQTHEQRKERHDRRNGCISG